MVLRARLLGLMLAAVGAAAAERFTVFLAALAAGLTGFIHVMAALVHPVVSVLSGLPALGATQHSHQPTSVLNHGIY
jgi:hypothetical protein